MKKSLSILITFLILLSISVSAQNKKFDKHMAAAKYFIGLNQFDVVIENLNEALKAEPNNQEAILFMADTYMKSRQFASAADWYKKVTEKVSNFPNRVWLHLGEASFELEDYENTLKYIENYTTQSNLPAKSFELAQSLERNSLFALENIKNPLDINLTNLGDNVNSNVDEYHPSMSADGLQVVFTRMDNFKEDLFISTRKSHSEPWSKAKSISSNINTGHNEGAHNLSADGNLLLLTICNKVGGEGSCDIYFSVKKGNEWTIPTNIDKPINSRFWESQPSLSADMKSLYFTSNRPGSYGGKDIWVSHLKEDKTWGEPVNLGPEVNTPMDEQSPLIHFDNETLYFSSYGHAGMGREDLFMSKKLPDGTFSKPINLGYPINTGKYEAGLFVSVDGTKGYYASNQPDGQGGQDIYEFILPENVRPNQVTYVKTRVVHYETGLPLIADFEITELSGYGLLKKGQTDANGYFLVCLPAGKDYSLQITKSGFLMESRHFSLAEKVAIKPFEMVVPIKQMKTEETIVLRNIFFETNKSNLLPSSYTELNKVLELLEKESNIRAEIIGHTDNIGSEEFNMELSRKRAESVVNYLVKSGIRHDRLTWKGMGESQPVDTNDTPEGRAGNRRTEMIIRY